MAVTNVTGEKGVSQDALLILCRVARLQVALFALMIAEDYVALDALQGELGGYGNQIGGGLHVTYLCIVRIQTNARSTIKGYKNKINKSRDRAEVRILAKRTYSSSSIQQCLCVMV